MKFFVLLMAIFFCQLTYAQNTFKAVVTSERTKEVLQGTSVSINNLNIGASADSTGTVTISNIPDGTYTIKISYAGYDDKQLTVRFPLLDARQVFTIQLEAKGTELGEVVIQTTRTTSRTIRDIPTRVEVISGEELDEKASLKPGDMKLLLNESTGIATQQTSAVSGTANIRIQGLDGRYTQFLRDGMPLYQGFSGGLSVMQIAPLDLRQVEFIKGSASTLYGGGAIAGLVNLISKTPTARRELSFLLNGTSVRGFDGSGFYSQKWKKAGATIFGSYNYNAPYDPSNVGFSAIPKTTRFTFNPKLFLYLSNKTSGWIGVTTTYEDRYGGDMQVLKGKANNIHRFFERNKTTRISTQLSLTHQLNENSRFNFKNSIGFFDRRLTMPQNNFNGQQVSSFSEFSYSHNNEKSDWVTGVNLWTDNFKSPNQKRLNYNLTTIGAFAQNVFKATEWFSLETGLRVDYNSPATNNMLKGIFILPRVNALLKFNEHWTSRIGGGLGYKMPTVFSEEAEMQGYTNIQPISFANTKAEKSYGGNADINYRNRIGDVSFSINQLFFYTYLNNPIILQNNNFINANGYIDTKGTETNFKLKWEGLQAFVGYTYTDANQRFNNIKTWQPLTPKHRLNAVLMFEKRDKFRLGIEGLFVSQQRLSDGAAGKGYVMYGLLFEKMWEHVNFFTNAENFTDRRQTRWDTIYRGSITNPTFRNIYAPLEGVVINAGVKIKL